MKSDKLYECIKYCEEQNGMPVCKNCGLDIDMVKEALEEAYERGRSDAFNEATKVLKQAFKL